MTHKVFFGKNMFLTVKDAAADDTNVVEPTTFPDKINVAVLKGVTLRPEFERSSLYGQGSILRQGVAQYNHRVTVTVKYAKFDGQLLGKILEAGGATEPDTNVDGVTIGSTGKTRFSVTDTTKPALFAVWGKVTANDGTSVFRTKVLDVYFNGFTMNFPEDDWVTHDLDGEGSRILLESLTPSATGD